jgi:hypothetical protein
MITQFFYVHIAIGRLNVARKIFPLNKDRFHILQDKFVEFHNRILRIVQDVATEVSAWVAREEPNDGWRKSGTAFSMLTCEHCCSTGKQAEVSMLGSTYVQPWPSFDACRFAVDTLSACPEQADFAEWSS